MCKPLPPLGYPNEQLPSMQEIQCPEQMYPRKPGQNPSLLPAIPASFRPETTVVKDRLTQQTSEASQLLRRELEWNGKIGQDRSIVLKRAIDFISHISNSEAPSSTTATFQPSTTDGDAEPQRFPPELWYIMIMSKYLVEPRS